MDKTEMTGDSLLLSKLFGDKGSCEIPPLPEDLSLAMAYVPYQQWETPYEDEVGLHRGTIFPCLDKPFIGEEAVRNADTQ